jgi:flagellin-like hook-associated protein FlgL
VDLINDAAGLVTAINTDLVAGGSSAEAYIDANSKLAFRETETGTGNGPLDINTMAVSNSTSDNANVNALMGFDFAQTSTGASSYAGAAAGFSLNGTDISLALAQVDGSVSAVEIADAVNTASATTGVTAYVDDADKLHFASDEAFTLADDTNASGFVAGLDTGANLNAGALSTAATSGSLKINGFEVGSISLTDVDAAATTINAAQANTGVTATIDDNGELQLSGNSTITLEAGQANGIASGRVLGVNFTDGSTPDGLLDAQTVNASIELTSINSSSPISLEINGNGATATGLKDLNTDLGATVTGSALSSISVGSAAGAQNAIESIDVALETINSTRSDLGAINNRLDFTVSNLSNVSENASAARSRIMDADFASETAALSRSQVLQQASQAMLAQANARPQQVLSLLN